MKLRLILTFASGLTLMAVSNHYFQVDVASQSDVTPELMPWGRWYDYATILASFACFVSGLMLYYLNQTGPRSPTDKNP